MSRLPGYFLCLSLSLVSPMAISVGHCEPVALESFFKTPQYPQMVLSPGGRWVATLASANGATNLDVIDLDGKTARAVTGYEAPETVQWVVWKSDTRLIYGAQRPDRTGFLVDTLGVVNQDGSNHMMLSDSRNSRERYGAESIVDLERADPKNILLASDRESLHFPSVYQTDTSSLWRAIGLHHDNGNAVFTTQRSRVAAGPGRNCSYRADNAGVVRTCLSLEEDLSRSLFYRADRDSPWQTVGRFTDSTGYIFPVGFTADNKTLYVISNYGRDTRALFEFDPATATQRKMLYEAPGVDIAEPVYATDGRRLIGVTYHLDASYVYYLDPEMERLQHELNTSFPGYSVTISSRSADGARAMVRVENDQTPGKYYLFDAAKREVRFVVDRAAWIDPKLMAMVKPVSLKTRDGLDLHGYLTLPPNRDARGLPLIMKVHGGPFGVRNVGRWDSSSQFLASRGYAVLSVNFRGSGGYGAKFQQAGHREWGGKMEDDVTDAVNWAVAQGVADSKRICIFGESYGGYAALMGLIRTPELYRCAISVAGVTDLSGMLQPLLIGKSIQRERPSEELQFWSSVIGERRDSEYLHERSPLYNVEKIHAPVFLAHGEDDWIVPLSDSVRLRNALETAHKEVEFLSKPDEGHGFLKEGNNIELYERIEKFLQKNNPAT
jgi:dipeptidyl aminopeptidase/acylaminoacyl peptidase